MPSSVFSYLRGIHECPVQCSHTEGLSPPSQTIPNPLSSPSAPPEGDPRCEPEQSWIEFASSRLLWRPRCLSLIPTRASIPVPPVLPHPKSSLPALLPPLCGISVRAEQPRPLRVCPCDTRVQSPGGLGGGQGSVTQLRAWEFSPPSLSRLFQPGLAHLDAPRPGNEQGNRGAGVLWPKLRWDLLLFPNGTRSFFSRIFVPWHLRGWAGCHHSPSQPAGTRGHGKPRPEIATGSFAERRGLCLPR